MLFWIYDKNEYYSSLTNKYLLINYNYDYDDINKIEISIKLGFDLSLITNRIFILPKIPCKSCKDRIYLNYYCNYITFFNIRELNNNLGEEKYRENVY